MKRCAPFMSMVAIAMLSVQLKAQSVEPKSASTDPVEELKALENLYDEAIVRRDVSALDHMTSDDFILVSLNGDLHAKQAVLKYFAAHTAEYEYRKTDNLRIRVYGDAAVVTGRTVQTVQENGKDHSDAYLFAHVYVRQRGRWLLVASQPTRVAVQ